VTAGTIVVVAVIIVYVIGRQLAGELLRAKRLIGSPAVLTVISVIDVATSSEPRPTAVGLALIAAGLVIAGVIGILQGKRMRLESRHGYLWGQMPASVLWLWAAYFASRGTVDVIGYAVHAQLATSSAVLLLGVGVNRLAQAVVVVPRALAADIPFGPETDKPLAELKDKVSQIKDRLSQAPGEVSRNLPPRGPEPRPPISVNDHPGSGEAESPRGSQPPPAPSAARPTRPGLARQIWHAFVREISERVADALK
jgi:hypothetical protein